MDKSTERKGSYSVDDAKRLAQSDAGKRLYATLQQNHGQQLQDAITQANAGNYTAVKKTISEMLNTPEVKAFLQQMGGNNDG